MTFINVGALINDENARSKKALREALATAPDSVLFYATSILGGGQEHYRGDELTTDLSGGVRLTVVGPDPYTSRKWYATVSITAKGVTLS